jgi:hypothetical protein
MGIPPLAFQTVGDMMFFGEDITLATYVGLTIYFIVATIVGIVAGLIAFSVLALPIITTIILKEIVIWVHIQNAKLPTEAIPLMITIAFDCIVNIILISF